MHHSQGVKSSLVEALTNTIGRLSWAFLAVTHGGHHAMHGLSRVALKGRGHVPFGRKKKHVVNTRTSCILFYILRMPIDEIISRRMLHAI